MSEKSIIRLPERFDFSFHKNFNATCDALLMDENLKEVELDFSQVLYLDSSALGMMVLLSKKLASKKTVLSIFGAHSAAAEIINMANLSKIYKIK